MLKCRADLGSDAPLVRVGSTAFAVNSPYVFLPHCACKGLQLAFLHISRARMLSSSSLSWKKRPLDHLESARVPTDGSSYAILFDAIHIQLSIPSSPSSLATTPFQFSIRLQDLPSRRIYYLSLSRAYDTPISSLAWKLQTSGKTAAQ
jgi:hypothetical protein